MNRKLPIVLALSAAFLLAGCSPAEPSINAAAIPAKVQSNTVSTYGIVKATHTESLFIDFPANIEKVHIKEGQLVKNGDKLFTLNLSEYRAKISNQEIAIAMESNEIANLKSDKPSKAKLDNDITYAQTFYDKAMKEYEKDMQLYNETAISQEELETQKKAVDAAKKTLDDAKAASNDLRYSENISISQKQLNIRSLQNDLKVLKGKLQKNYIKGNDIISNLPYGVVFDIGYSPLEQAQKEIKAVSILDMNSRVIEAYIAEEFIKDIKIGKKAAVTPQADRDRTYTGKVSRIANKTMQKNGETDIIVEITLDKWDGFLLPGMNVDIVIVK